MFLRKEDRKDKLFGLGIRASLSSTVGFMSLVISP